MPEIEIDLFLWLPGPEDKWGGRQSSKGGAAGDGSESLLPLRVCPKETKAQEEKGFFSFSCDSTGMVETAAVLPPLRKSF
jgi:hypothetical protein